MERAPEVCPVCGLGKPLNAAGIPVSCCSRVPPLPVRADEHASFVRVVRERADEALVTFARTRELMLSPVAGCAVTLLGALVIVGLLCLLS